MRRSPVSFEWQVAEDEAEWEEMALPPALFTEEQPPLGNVDRRLVVYLLRGAAICLASIVLVTGAGLTQEEQDRFQATAGIQAVLVKEAQEVAQTESEKLASAANLFNAPPVASHGAAKAASLQNLGVGLIRVEPVGELALAEVLLTQPVQGWRQVSPYRETRFYRKTATGWRQTTPDRAFWGQRIYRETAHLRFEFLARDAESVEPLLDQMDTIYQSIYIRLGLPMPPTAQKLTVEVIPSNIAGRGFYDDRLQVSSPLMAQVPSEFSATTFLAHQMVSGLLINAISSSATRASVGVLSEDSFAFRWRAMRRGLRSWLQSKLLAQAWPWDRQAAELFLRTQHEHFPLTLDNITWGTELPLTDEERLMWQNAAAESVIAYVVETYGEKRLPDLLRGFYQYHDWEDLVASTFGISAAAFEAGWNRYLARQAGLPIEYIQVYQIEQRAP